MPDIASPPDGPSIEALRERGAARLDPVRFRLIEALARRAQAHEGAARRVLDDRLATLQAACGQRLAQAPAGSVSPAPATMADAPARGPLAGLAARLARPGVRPPTRPAAGVDQPAAEERASPVDAASLEFFRRTWSRLSAEQRLTQSLSALPENAGPLNSHQLVHRALTTMRELSPAYFEQFMAYADALLWLELAQSGGVPDLRKPARGR